jgi:hypothetical protein
LTILKFLKNSIQLSVLLCAIILLLEYLIVEMPVIAALSVALPPSTIGVMLIQMLGVIIGFGAMTAAVGAVIELIFSLVTSD